jgi:hypothetical protein
VATAVLVYIVIALFILNVIATFTSMRSEVVTSGQKALQLAFIWLIPVAGAIVVLLVLGPSRASGSSRNESGGSEDSEERLTALSSSAGGRSHHGHDVHDAHGVGGDGQ